MPEAYIVLTPVHLVLPGVGVLVILFTMIL